jgi:hypothetical protein
MPILRAVPATMLIAASTSAALRSCIFCSAIFLKSAFEIVATFVLFGVAEPLSTLHAFLSNTAAGGVFVMKENDLSA